MTNDFTTIFELTAVGVRANALFHVTISVGLIVAGILGFIFHKRILAVLPGNMGMGIFGLMVAGGLVWGLVQMNLLDFALSDIAGNTRMAEGVVRVQHEQPYEGHTSGDKITVGGQPFVVDYFHDTPGYHKTIAHGGALSSGVYARLHYCNDVIIKVEVRTNEPGQPSSTGDASRRTAP